MRTHVQHSLNGVSGPIVPALVGEAPGPSAGNVSTQETLSIMIAWRDWKCQKAVMKRSVQPSLSGLTGQSAPRPVEEVSGRR